MIICRLRSLLFGVMVLLPLAAAGQQINLSVTNIPANATRWVAVVDGGGISGTLRASQDVPTGTGSSSLALGVPSGGPYRVRVIAFVAGGIFPSILRSGKTTGVAVASGATVNASVSLADVSFSVDSSTPSSANEGASVAVKINIADRGDFLDGVSFGQLWGGAKPPTQNPTGAPTPGALTSLGNGAYEFTTAVNLPTAGPVFYYQFEATAFAFANPDGTEAPLLLWPNQLPGVIPPQITLSSASGVNLTVSNIPATATRVVAVADTGPNSGTLRTSQNVSPGVGTSTFFIGLPASTGYRIRVIAYVPGSRTTTVLRSGKTTGLSVMSGATTSASVALADVSGTLDPSSPSSAPVGRAVTIRINITDPGDFLDGGYGALYVYTSPPVTNGNGSIISSEGGSLANAGGGAYIFTFSDFPPGAGTIYYQFSGSSSAFNDTSTPEYPYLFVPNLDTGEQAFQITFLSTYSVFVSVGNIPSSAIGLVSVVDGGPLSTGIITGQGVSPGVGSFTLSVGVPAGGPYRIRVVAINQSTISYLSNYVLASGKATGISVGSAGPNNASVILADVSGAVDPSTPTSGAAGSSVTIKLNLTDPGDFLDGLSSGRLWYVPDEPFNVNRPPSGATISGTLASTMAGSYQFTAAANLPTSGGTLYYQFGETTAAFTPPGSGSPSFLVWPDVAAGEQPAQISVTGPLGITSLNPPSATAGGSAFSLTVNGTGFVPGSTVQWNASALSATFASASQLTALVPPSLIATRGTASVTVSNPGGATSNSATFTIAAPQAPMISALSPSSIAAGSAGFTLTVIGSGFFQGAAVQWNGSALVTTFVSGNQLTASVSANLITVQGVASITVGNPGSATSNSANFTINAPGPTVSSLSPNSVPAGGAAFSLTVNGSSFVMGSAVQWNGATLTTIYVGGTQLMGLVPASLIAKPGIASVTVMNPGGTPSNAANFTITIPAPTISALSPDSSTAGGSGFPLTVNGSGFVLGAAVLWNGVALVTNYVGGSQLIALAPANLIAMPGTATLTVVNLGGATSNPVQLNINAAAPVVSSLSPSSASAGGPAFTLTVNGAGFVLGSIVGWNGVSKSSTYVSATQLTASVSASLIASTGTATVAVTNPDGTKSNSVNFTITAGLSIVTASPLPSGMVGVRYSQTLTATGGTVPYKGWTVTSGSLPPGILLTTVANTSLLSGTPTSPGTSSFTVQVTDSANTVVTKQFSLTIAGSLVSISPGGIVNSASYAGGGVAPGEIVTIFGSGLGPNALSNTQLDSRGYVSTLNSGTQVLFDGVAAPIIYTQAAQVSVIVPYEVSGTTSTQVHVMYQGQTSSSSSVKVSAVMPGIFTSDSSGSGQGSILNQDGTVNSPSNPATVGSYVSLYATGEGQTNPAGIDGKPASVPAPVPVAQPVTATIGGVPATVQYAGGSPSSVAGLIQVNVQIPQVPAGSAVPIVITVGGQSSQSGASLAVK
jgi:uncharacterized protein (TIGR03437 family)